MENIIPKLAAVVAVVEGFVVVDDFVVSVVSDVVVSIVADGVVETVVPNKVGVVIAELMVVVAVKAEDKVEDCELQFLRLPLAEKNTKLEFKNNNNVIKNKM
jgi:hypothetical protein